MYLKDLTLNEKTAFYAFANSLVSADGVVIENESYMLEEFLGEMGLTRDRIECVEFDKALSLVRDSGIRTKKQIYIELLGLAMCDREYVEEEQSLMICIADAFGISAYEREQLSECVSELYDVYSKMETLIAE